MKIKDGVDLSNMHAEMWHVASVVDEVFEFHGADCTITSGREGTHGTGSLHGKGRALDFRTRDLGHLTVDLIAERVANELGADFDVVVHIQTPKGTKKISYKKNGVSYYEGPREVNHLHVEYQPQ